MRGIALRRRSASGLRVHDHDMRECVRWQHSVSFLSDRCIESTLGPYQGRRAGGQAGSDRACSIEERLRRSRGLCSVSKVNEPEM